MILSLFSGCGGLDLGFESAGFTTGLAYDIRAASVNSWNQNRDVSSAFARDLSSLNISQMDADYGEIFRPKAVIGGPPCQSFTNANSFKNPKDPRTKLISVFFDIAIDLHIDRNPLDFIVMENVRELATSRYEHVFEPQVQRLKMLGFHTTHAVLDAADYGVPQHRKRLFFVAINNHRFPDQSWELPGKVNEKLTVQDVISKLPQPQHFERGLSPNEFPFHPNHWCMKPKSKKFRDGSLSSTKNFGRSFKTLAWDKPSYTVSYGNREVHVHPSGKRRLSVFEAMKLQGFPDDFVLQGNLSEQITQVSEAVPPPLAYEIAKGIHQQLYP